MPPQGLDPAVYFIQFLFCVFEKHANLLHVRLKTVADYSIARRNKQSQRCLLI